MYIEDYTETYSFILKYDGCTIGLMPYQHKLSPLEIIKQIAYHVHKKGMPNEIFICEFAKDSIQNEWKGTDGVLEFIKTFNLTPIV